MTRAAGCHTGRARRLAAGALTGALAAAAVTAPARGLDVYGGLRALAGAGGCVADAGRQARSARRCSVAARGLRGASALALGRDGAQLYVASPADSAVVVLARTSAGRLAPAGRPSGRSCMAAPGGAQCALTDSALAGVDALAVSPDARFLYAGATDAAAVAGFARGRGGLLRPLGAQMGKPGPGRRFGCVQGRLVGAPAACAGHSDALSSVATVVVSPEGRHVYAVSFGLDAGGDSVVALARDGRTGGLAAVGGRGGCLASRPGSSCQSVHGLEGPRALVLSRDGRFAYVAASISGAVTALSRDPRSGRLRPLSGPGGCVSDATTAYEPQNPRCAVAVPQLTGARALALSPDGRQLYVASLDPGALVVLDRDPVSGRLAAMAGPPLCLQAVADAACPTGLGWLRNASAVAVNHDGRLVFVAAEGGDSVTELLRDPASGRLVVATPHPARIGGLDGPEAMALAPDGRTLYLASPFDDAVAGLVP